MATKAKIKPKAGTSREAAAQRKALFIDAYVSNGGNAADAARTAGYSPKSAAQQASRLLTDANLQQEIAARAKKTAQKYELSTELVVKTIVQELTFDPAALYDGEGRLKSVLELPPDIRAALTSVEFEQHGSAEAPVFVRKYKWAMRNQAREQAMKHLGMFEADNKQKHPLAELTPEQLDAFIQRKAKEAGVSGESLPRLH